MARLAAQCEVPQRRQDFLPPVGGVRVQRDLLQPQAEPLRRVAGTLDADGNEIDKVRGKDAAEEVLS